MIFLFFRPPNGPLVQKLDLMQGAKEVWRNLKKISRSKTGLWSFVIDWHTCKLLSSYLRPTRVDKNIVWEKVTHQPSAITAASWPKKIQKKSNFDYHIVSRQNGLFAGMANASTRSCPRSTIDTSKYQTGPIQTTYLSIKTIPDVSDQASENSRFSTFLDWSSDLYYIYISWFNICVFVFENSINWWMLWQWGGGRQENINLNCYQIFNRWYVCLFMYFLSLSSLLCHHHLD